VDYFFCGRELLFPMEFLVDFFEVGVGDVGVDLGGVNTGVSK
jgi:hypothetical protein